MPFSPLINKPCEKGNHSELKITHWSRSYIIKQGFHALLGLSQKPPTISISLTPTAIAFYNPIVLFCFSLFLLLCKNQTGDIFTELVVPKLAQAVNYSWASAIRFWWMSLAVWYNLCEVKIEYAFSPCSGPALAPISSLTSSSPFRCFSPQWLPDLPRSFSLFFFLFFFPQFQTQYFHTLVLKPRSLPENFLPICQPS